MVQHFNVCWRCVSQLCQITLGRYAQWVIADPMNQDYRVTASALPQGDGSYEIAHRTGIIGQVFRTEKPIFTPDVTSHPLYDPFDHSIAWELCFPVFLDGKLEAVINLEGTGTLEFSDAMWKRIGDLVREATGGSVPSSPPRTHDNCLVDTHRLLVRASSQVPEKSDFTDFARAIAGSTQSTLLVGDFPELLNGRQPSMVEAAQQGLAVSYCFFGVEQRLDLLATGSAAAQTLLDNQMNWWESCKGRYSFVLAYAEDSPVR